VLGFLIILAIFALLPLLYCGCARSVFTLSRLQGTVPIPGAKDLVQMRENLGALGWRLSAGEVAALEEAADRVPKAMVQNIFATA
jgi:hypothetical protein